MMAVITCFLPLNVRHFDIRKSTSASNDIINAWIPFSCSSPRARVVLARARHFSSLPFHHICLIAWDGMRRILECGSWRGGVRSSGGLMGVYSLRRHQQMDLCRWWSGPIITDIQQLQPTVCSLVARDAYINQHGMLDIFFLVVVKRPP